MSKMKIKYLYIDKDNNVIISKNDLDELMKQCYDDGFIDGSCSHSNYLTTTPWYSYNEVTCNNNSINQGLGQTTAGTKTTEDNKCYTENASY